MNLIELTERFNTEEAARTYLESLRWPIGPVCPKCGSVEAYALMPREGSTSPVRPGVYKCKARHQFTVTVGTIFERSHIPLRIWVIAIHLMCASKKGMSAHQLHRMLGISYKSAWFMAHRIRHAMTQPPMSTRLQGIVEADEAYIGGKRKGWGRAYGVRSTLAKTPVVTLVERNGRARSVPMPRVTPRNLREHVTSNVDPGAHLMTDELPAYRGVGVGFARHDVVRHADGEYARSAIHVNSAESYFALLKRGIVGTFHHVSREHLHRYLAEFDFRYTFRKVEDGHRAAQAVCASGGKRLTLRSPRTE